MYNLGSTKQNFLCSRTQKLSQKKGGRPMEPVKNLNDKRICDISKDRKVIEILQKGCLTRITANPDGTLNVENVPVPHAA